MARLYANENFPRQAVIELRRLGHDVLTSLEAGNANRSIPDDEVLAYATAQQRILLTHNRVHFLRLHRQGLIGHAGIVICTADSAFERLGQRVHDAIKQVDNPDGQVFRVTRLA